MLLQEKRSRKFPKIWLEELNNEVIIKLFIKSLPEPDIPPRQESPSL